VNGNPRFNVFYENENGEFGHAKTMSDSSCAYGITNKENIAPNWVELEFTKAGNIRYIKTTKESEEK
jgi:hypothetical protein